MTETPPPPRRISPWVALIPGAVIAILLTLGLPFILGQDDTLPSTLVGRPAPAVEVAPMPGHLPPDAAMFTDGQPKLVNFWASWCAPCRIEHPQMMALAKSGLPIIGLNYKDELANAQKFLDDLGNPYVAVGAVDGRAAVEWGVYGVPETFLVDGQGKIRLRIAGPITDVILRTQLQPALDSLN